MEQRKRRVLVVDDDPKIRVMVRKSLEAMGHEVLEAIDGQQAIDLLTEQGHALDLVCLDVMLPKFSGFDVCEALQRSSAALKSVPILIMSARVAPLDRALAEELGAAAYLCKPFGLKDFAAQVRALLESKAQTKPAR